MEVDDYTIFHIKKGISSYLENERLTQSERLLIMDVWEYIITTLELTNKKENLCSKNCQFYKEQTVSKNRGICSYGGFMVFDNLDICPIKKYRSLCE